MCVVIATLCYLYTTFLFKWGVYLHVQQCCDEVMYVHSVYIALLCMYSLVVSLVFLCTHLLLRITKIPLESMTCSHDRCCVFSIQCCTSFIIAMGIINNPIVRKKIFPSVNTIAHVMAIMHTY